MAKKFSDTSLEAYKKVDPKMQQRHYEKIMFALSELGIATMEQIAAKAGLELNQVTRRVCELEDENKLHKADKSKTTKGRTCWRYRIGKAHPLARMQKDIREGIEKAAPKRKKKKKKVKKPVTKPLYKQIPLPLD